MTERNHFTCSPKRVPRELRLGDGAVRLVWWALVYDLASDIFPQKHPGHAVGLSVLQLMLRSSLHESEHPSPSGCRYYSPPYC